MAAPHPAPPPEPGIGQAHLFEPPAAVRLTLNDRFLVPPFSVLDARAGYWQDRKREWLELGIQSELGRAGGLLGYESFANPPACPRCNATGHDAAGKRCYDCAGTGRKYGKRGGHRTLHTTSVFDPVVCELVYRWWAPHGGLVYDPFAGGSVRGIVAACLGRRYLGVDLRPEQVEANRAQAAAIGAGRGWQWQPQWVVGDSRDTPAILGSRQPDFVFTCPPYYDLEQYSDDPRDLSNAPGYAEFLAAYQEIIGHCCRALHPDRFACFVVGEVRRPDGGYTGLVADTTIAFTDRLAGCKHYNDMVLLTPLGSAPIRASAQFGSGRKVGKVHQNVLVYVKGEGRAAAAACGPVPEVALEYGLAAWQADGTAPAGDDDEEEGWL